MNSTESTKRPTRMKAADRKARILTTSVELIAAKGFKAISVREIAERNAINEALLYHYFPTKEALLNAIMAEIRAASPGYQAERCQSESEFWQGLADFIVFFIKLNSQQGRAIRIILFAILEGYQLPADFDLASERSFFHWVKQGIQQGQAQWGFRPEIDPKQFFAVLLGTLIYCEMENSILQQGPIEPGLFLVGALQRMVK